MSKLKQWLESMEYLPPFLRDFHDQKDLFKSIHTIYRDSDSLKPSWPDGMIYVIDCFLWFMAWGWCFLDGK